MQQVLDRSTHFLFEHKLFTVKGARFAFTADGEEPAFHVALGDLQAALRLPALKSEFGIAPDSSDAQLLAVVEQSLRYVKEIRPGDSIPRELLDGSASWTVEERHRIIARGRLLSQLLSGLKGKETAVGDPAALERLLADPGIAARSEQAAAELAEKLGLGAGHKREVIERIDALARELCYIEALRERCVLVQVIVAKINILTKLYAGDRALINEISRVQTLLQRPIADFTKMFDSIDAATGDLAATLRKFDAQIKFIRETRDEVHARLMTWDPVIVQWQEVEPVRGAAAEAALKEIYRFAARHFMQRQDWKF